MVRRYKMTMKKFRRLLALPPPPPPHGTPCTGALERRERGIKKKKFNYKKFASSTYVVPYVFEFGLNPIW
jgi:hypothetical protein